ncbi:MAG: PAS domain-containing protein, partial [Desulfobacula sp.]|nr:PAS domain-containing protein [Desulfobacula sp.]
LKSKSTPGDQIGQLSSAINHMGTKIHEKQIELNRQKDIYRHLFEQVPCTITVQNKKFELVEFNQEFARRFNPEYGDYCYAAYKGLDSKCLNCPVEKTFIDGKSHFSEESGINKDGSIAHWFVKTAPLKDENGNIVAAMEMSLDISRRKKLEEKVRISEKKYQEIFKNIPNPVFILDKEQLTIIDCNDSVLSV